MTLAIYCAGGLGREVIELARSVNRWDRIIFVDDVTDQKICSDAEVYRFEELDSLNDNIEFVIASGEPDGRFKLWNKIKESGYRLTNIIAKDAGFLRDTKVGEGCIIYKCGISTRITIGDNVIININTIIGHDTIIGQSSVISANCFIGGKTNIGDRVFMGACSCLKDNITVGNDSIISMGAVVLRNVRDEAIMIGNPAKRIGMNTTKKVFGN